jgi:hypothetical protein
MPNNPPAETYRSFLIRCWTTPVPEGDRPPNQRFVLETVSNTPDRRGFDTLADLVAFLQTELAAGEYQLTGGTTVEDNQ